LFAGRSVEHRTERGPPCAVRLRTKERITGSHRDKDARTRGFCDEFGNQRRLPHPGVAADNDCPANPLSQRVDRVL
jgi:hypothetical protein